MFSTTARAPWPCSRFQFSLCIAGPLPLLVLRSQSPRCPADCRPFPRQILVPSRTLFRGSSNTNRSSAAHCRSRLRITPLPASAKEEGLGGTGFFYALTSPSASIIMPVFTGRFIDRGYLRTSTHRRRMRSSLRLSLPLLSLVRCSVRSTFRLHAFFYRAPGLRISMPRVPNDVRGTWRGTISAWHGIEHVPSGWDTGIGIGPPAGGRWSSCGTLLPPRGISQAALPVTAPYSSSKDRAAAPPLHTSSRTESHTFPLY